LKPIGPFKKKFTEKIPKFFINGKNIKNGETCKIKISKTFYFLFHKIIIFTFVAKVETTE